MAEKKKGLLGAIKAAGGKVWDELAPAAGHGSSEVAAALFTGSAFVMYPRAGEQMESAGMASLRSTTQEAAKSDTQDRDGPEQSRGMER